MMANVLKKWTTSTLLMALLVSSGVTLNAADTMSADDAYKAMYARYRAKDYAPVTAEAIQAARDSSLTTAQKLNFLKIATMASVIQGSAGVEDTIAVQKMILEDKAVSNNDKVTAYGILADALLNAQAGLDLKDMDTKPSVEALHNALKLVDLSDEDQAAAQLQLGVFYQQSQQYDVARTHYSKAIALVKTGKTLAEAHKGVAELEALTDHLDRAAAYAKANDVDLIALYKRFGSEEQMTAAAVAVLDDEAIRESTRWSTFISKLPAMHHRNTDWERAVTLGKKYMPAFAQVDAKRGYSLANKYRYAAQNTAYDYMLWAAPYILNTPGLKSDIYSEVQSGVMHALAAKRQLVQFDALCVSLADDTQADDALRARIAMVQLAAKSKANVDADQMLLIVKLLENKKKIEVIESSARMLLALGNEEKARTVYALRDRLLVAPARASIICEFHPDGPFDIGSWQVSSVIRDAKSSGKLDRPYGDNLRFLLETDASTKGRGVDSAEVNATIKDSGDRRTEFHVSANVDGIHLLFKAYDTRINEVADGQLKGGSYEMYLAPGEHQPYYTFLARLPAGVVNATVFTTMYPNARYRNLTSEDNRFDAQTRRVGESFDTTIFLGWDVFYDKLPSNGDKWQFDAIRWTRSGGLSFGGSQSVHNRSSWGDIVFEGMSEKNLIAIKRKIIFSAMTRYAADKRLTGVAGNWEDRELGDPAFYNAKVKPLLEHLDTFVVKTGERLSDADVERIYELAVPGWMELAFMLDALRAAWLQDALLGKDVK